MDKEEIRKALLNTVVIVSGIPRSGTSLMMQILEAGGIELLIDNKREPDDSNPKGYYEFEPVKSLEIDNAFIREAVGKAVKVISQLLEFLPEQFNYKIIFMRREMEEILRSQQKMLGINSEEDNDLDVVIKVFERDINKADEWAKNNPNIEILFINFKDVINNPIEVIQKLSSFLGLKLDSDKMIEVIDPDLYRSKPLME